MGESGMAHAGKIVDAQQAAELEKSGDHLFFGFEDAAKIDRFLKSIVSQSAAMYEGTWVVSDDSDAHLDKSILHMAFGSSSSDEHGPLSTSKGRVRTFISKINL